MEKDNNQINAPETAVSDKKPKKNIFSFLKGNKKIKNQALFKRGGYSIAITAAVLAVLIIFNWLVSVLAKRVNLEYDMTAEKINTVSKENLDYLKKVKEKINIIVCTDEEHYSDYMGYYCSNNNVTQNTDYFDQTKQIIERYTDSNPNITVSYIDTQSSEFVNVSNTYSALSPSYSDIIVSTEKTDDKTAVRSKKIAFGDIYKLTDESGGGAEYGYASYTIGSNNIENALTSAISYVITKDTKKVAFLTGHSSTDYSSYYSTLLKNNNYEVETVSDALITANSLPDDCDLIAIMAPSVDFIDSELDAISSYLDNKGKMGRGLIFFADALCPYLPHFYEYLSDWGINIDEGVLFAVNPIGGDDATTMPIAGVSNTIADNMICITGQNVPMLAGEAAESTITATALMNTYQGGIKVPAGSPADYSGYTEDDLKQYANVIEAKKSETDGDGNNVSSSIMAFSSIEFIDSDWVDYEDYYNKNICLAAADSAANVGDVGISFVTKTITNESFSDSVTETGTNVIRIIFMYFIPIAVLALGIYIFIRRKNAE